MDGSVARRPLTVPSPRQSHMGAGRCGLYLLPSGRRWPEGSDEGVNRFKVIGFRFLGKPPHPPGGTFSPKGEGGALQQPPSHAIAVLSEPGKQRRSAIGGIS